jgi:hypothetical protein
MTDLHDGTDAGVARARLARQFITAPVKDSVAGLVRRLVAVQAQDFTGSKWALGLRLAGVAGVNDQEVERAFNAGEILRTHVLRPTWHFVTPADIRALLLLTGPRVLAQNESMCRKLGLDPHTLNRSASVMARALEGGRHLTRDALRAAVEGAGIPTAALQRMTYIMMHAELTGVVCSGPRDGRQFTYALLEERVPPARTTGRDAVLVDVATRYHATRAPATAQDFAKWSGLTVAAAARAFDGLPPPRAVRVARPVPRVHLLSIYDEYISSYRDRSAIVSPAHGERLVKQGAALSWIIVLDGRIVGTFRRVVQRRGIEMQPTLFVNLTRAERAALASAAERQGAFFGLAASVK